MFIYIHPEDLYLYLQGEKINMKNNKKGFTLMEMLIVVAIIAVLVAIAIPVLNGTLEKAREATDAANLRAAYAEVSVNYLDGKTGDNLKKEVTPTQTEENWTSTITDIAGLPVKKGKSGTGIEGLTADSGDTWEVAYADGKVTITTKKKA